jgi:EmrB/QacA subfamily drug resistance transporter
MAERGQRLLLVSLMTVPVAMLLNAGMVNIALPSIRGDLNIGVAQAAWIVAAYSVPLVVLMPLGNTIGNLLGKRRALLAGLALFGLASWVSAQSRSFEWLIAARILQGVGISGLSPICMALIAELFAPSERGRAIGFWQAAGPVAFAVGPVLGGFIVQLTGWRGIFYVLALAALLGLAFVARYTPEFAPTQALVDVDWKGVVALSAGLGAILLALAGLNADDTDMSQSISLLSVGVVVIGAFIWIESREIRPLVDLGLLRKRGFGLAATAAGLRSGTISSTTLLLSLFLQEVSGYTATQAGLIFIPRSITAFFVMPTGGRLADRLRSPSLLGAAGMMLMALCLTGLTRVHANSAASQVAIILGLFGIGMGAALPAIAKTVVESVEYDKIGMAVSLERMSHSSGVVVGPSVIGLLLASRLEARGPISAAQATVHAYSGMFWVLAVVALLGGLLLVAASDFSLTLGSK